MLKFEFNKNLYQIEYWEPSLGHLGNKVSLDTETSLIKKGEIPQLILAQAYFGTDSVYFIRAQQMQFFLEAHRGAQFIMHNGPFDIHVLEASTPFNFDQAIRGNRVWDTGLLYRLIKLATTGDVPRGWSLKALADELLGIHLNKDEGVRKGFGSYIQDNKNNEINYENIDEKSQIYAASDTIATWLIYDVLWARVQAIDPKYYLSHKIQIMGAFGLHRIELNGIGLAEEYRQRVIKNLNVKSNASLRTLHQFGVVPGTKGVSAGIQSMLREEEQRLGITLEKTGKKGDRSTKEEHLSPFRDQSIFINAYATYRETLNLLSFINKLSGNRIYPRFNVLVNTGRTSCSGPNLQNLPRTHGIRECFVPSPDHHFLLVDYNQLELCTLAQSCFERYGESRMMQLINEGVDLHRWFASVLLNKEESEITSEERQLAKACNFGFPGGLGAKAFLDYARKTYSIQGLTELEAIGYRDQWLDAFPEMRKYLDEDRNSLRQLLSMYDFSACPQAFWGQDASEIAAKIFLRIIGGHESNTKGSHYSEQLTAWAFDEVLPAILPGFRRISKGSKELQKVVLSNITVRLKTGRVRAWCGYCAAKNTPFQGLASDGTKIALYRLVRAGYKVVNFVHDEFILEIPTSGDLEKILQDVESIAVRAMRVVAPDVEIKVESYFADRWYKKGNLIRSTDGRIVPYRNQGGLDDA